MNKFPVQGPAALRSTNHGIEFPHDTDPTIKSMLSDFYAMRVRIDELVNTLVEHKELQSSIPKGNRRPAAAIIHDLMERCVTTERSMKNLSDGSQERIIEIVGSIRQLLGETDQLADALDLREAIDDYSSRFDFDSTEDYHEFPNLKP